MNYQLTRNCQKCQHQDIFVLTKTEAAFELFDSKVIWVKPCSNCNSTKCDAISYNQPEIDKELLDLWGNDLTLYFLQQDEELILAEMKYLPLLLNAIDHSNYLPQKIAVLTNAACILLYDLTVAPEEYSKKENEEREQLANQVRPELIKRKEKILLAETEIMDYIKIVVFPQLFISRS